MARVLPAATLLAVTVSVVALARTAPPAQPFQRIDACIYKPQRWNDGDSFHVILPDQKQLIFRLYFVDAPEEERAYADRIVEQAAYFGISTDAAVVEIKSLLGDGRDSRAGQNIAGLPCAFPGWSIVVRCVLLSALSGPVAQRLEKGTHNLVSFLLLRARA